jgi:hypothetical protein
MMHMLHPKSRMTVHYQRHAESLAEGPTYTSGRIVSQIKMPQTLSRASTSGGSQIPNEALTKQLYRTRAWTPEYLSCATYYPLRPPLGPRDMKRGRTCIRVFIVRVSVRYRSRNAANNAGLAHQFTNP